MSNTRNQKDKFLIIRRAKQWTSCAVKVNLLINQIKGPDLANGESIQISRKEYGDDITIDVKCGVLKGRFNINNIKELKEIVFTVKQYDIECIVHRADGKEMIVYNIVSNQHIQAVSIAIMLIATVLFVLFVVFIGFNTRYTIYY